MGSITLTKAKGIWQTLPVPLRGAATLLAVLALAALLTTVRHNASAYLTGVWDTGSQTLVYGRIHQMEQGQHAPGGFLGVYTDDWSDDTNRALFRDDTPTDAAAFHPYTHQSGLQGWLFGRVNRLLRHWLPDGLARETALYWLNSTLFYAAELLVALALWFAQEWLCFGSAADAWQNMTRAVTDRVSLTDGAVRDVNMPQVLAQYFRESTEPLLQLGPVSVTAWQLLLFALLAGAVSVVACLRRGTAAQLVPPCIVWGLGLAAPASWMVLSKAHAAIHTHLVPMLWHFAFVPISCMLLPVLAKLMIPGRKKDLVASH